VLFAFNLQSATMKNPLDSRRQLHQFETYKKRSGTGDQGKEYEKLMCTLLALKFSTSDIVADFEMKANCKDYGDLDDVALEVTFMDGQSHTFLFQLKHSENPKKITDTKLAAGRGDFSLLKYIKSIRTFENAENVSFILYTNYSTSIKSNSKFCLQNKGNTNAEVHVRELPQLDSKKLLLMSRQRINDKEGTEVFQFELNQCSGSLTDFDKSLKHFYLFSDQTNAAETRSLIKNMFRDSGINDDTWSSNFIQFMETWWSGNFTLTKYDVVAKLAESMLTPFIVTISDSKFNEKSKLLREAIMKFDMTIVRDTNEEVIANIWKETASDDEISFTLRKYYGKSVKKIKDLPPNEKTTVLWHLNKVPLIVKAKECKEQGKDHEAQVKHAMRLLQKDEKKKIVLLTNATKEEFPGRKIFQDLSDLLNDGVYTDIIRDFKVSLQGRQLISLEQLLNFDHENCRSFETRELIKMAHDHIQIGRKQKKVFENYIPRSVSTINVDIMKMTTFCKKTNSLLIICNVSDAWNEAIRQLHLHVMELDQYLNLKERNKFDILLTSNQWHEVRFNDICEMTEKNVHLLQVLDNKSCTSVLSKESRFSLRTMKSEGTARIDEKDIFTDLDHPLNFICSPPGMGKSTLVSRLSSICPSSYWSVSVNLINHKKVFKKESKHDEILQHLFQEDEDQLVVKIRSTLLENKRMYFFLDGLDEIDSDCIPIALDLIKHISSLGHRVWVTSRENLEQTVSHSLNVFPIKIEELTEQQQKKYIQDRLQVYQNNEVEIITNKIYANVDIANSRHLLGVPLQLFMVTENFRSNKDLSNKPDQEIFVLTKMYKIFLQGKKKHQHNKLGVEDHNDLFNYYFDLYLEQYELPALKSCLDAKTFDKLNINLGKNQKFLERLKTEDLFQIVSGVTDDNQAIFNHQTYAEYFACAWLKNNWDKVSLLQNDLFTEENQNLKFIFDIMLAENSALHLAIIYRDTKLVSKHLDKIKVKDEGGRNPLQLLCSYCVEHPPLSLTEDNWRFFDSVKHISYRTCIENNIEDVSSQYREILKMLLGCSELQNDDEFRLNCLDYAIRLPNLFAVEEFLQRFRDKISLKKLFEKYEPDTLAYYSSQMGYANLLRAAIKKDPKALSVKIGKCNLTLLHVAIIGVKKNNKNRQTLMKECIEVMTTLIECDLDVNAQCGRQTTALHLASELDDDVIVKFLLEKGANINSTDIFGRNALHFALKNSQVNMGIVKLLMDKRINAEARDKNGKSPLHLCCREGHYDALVKLLDYGLDVKVVTENKLNLLHTICRQPKPNEEIMKLLISKGVDVNGEDCGGRNVLHYTCHHDMLRKAPGRSGDDVNAINNYKHHTILSDTSKAKIITLLLENGAKVNAKDSANRSVLHYVAFQRNYKCIKELLDHGADINAICNFGKTVLHSAFEDEDSPDSDVIQLLLSHYVDANKRDNNQKTALDYAVTSTESHRVMNMLFDAKIHNQLISTDHVTFLHYAVYHGNKFAVELFLAGELDLDKIDVNNMEYPLHFAVEDEHLKDDLLLKMTEFIRDCKKKANFERKRIVQLLEEYFSNGFGSECVSFFNINLWFFFVYIFQKVTCQIESNVSLTINYYNRSRILKLYCLFPCC
jgi:ankyrin repeat protein